LDNFEYTQGFPQPLGTKVTVRFTDIQLTLVACQAGYR